MADGKVLDVSQGRIGSELLDDERCMIVEDSSIQSGWRWLKQDCSNHLRME